MTDDPEILLYAIVDTAADERLYALVQDCEEKRCMFEGKIEEPLVRAAPWIVRLEPHHYLYKAWHQIGIGKAWGILIHSPCAMNDIRRHLRHFLQATLPDGEVVLFRFYDPRIFRTYLPSCTPEELDGWFDLVSSFVVEKEGGGFHEFQWADDHLFDGDTPI